MWAADPPLLHLPLWHQQINHWSKRPSTVPRQRDGWVGCDLRSAGRDGYPKDKIPAGNQLRGLPGKEQKRHQCGTKTLLSLEKQKLNCSSSCNRGKGDQAAGQRKADKQVILRNQDPVAKMHTQIASSYQTESNLGTIGTLILAESINLRAQGGKLGPCQHHCKINIRGLCPGRCCIMASVRFWHFFCLLTSQKEVSSIWQNCSLTNLLSSSLPVEQSCRASSTE